MQINVQRSPAATFGEQLNFAAMVGAPVSIRSRSSAWWLGDDHPLFREGARALVEGSVNVVGEV